METYVMDAPPVGETGGAENTSRMGNQTGENQFTQTDGRNLRTLLVDFQLAALGDQGQNCKFTDEDRKRLNASVGMLKILVDRVVYGGTTHE